MGGTRTTHLTSAFTLFASPTFFVVSLFVSLLQQHQHQNAPFCQQRLSSKHILRSGLMPRFWGWEIMVLLCALSATLLCSARPLSHGGNGAKWFNGPKLHTLTNTKIQKQIQKQLLIQIHTACLHLHRSNGAISYIASKLQSLKLPTQYWSYMCAKPLKVLNLDELQLWRLNSLE